jgi:hypothetical protein
MYEMDEKDRLVMGHKGREHVLKNYSMDKYVSSWQNLLEDIHKRFGSWDTINKKQWSLQKVL